MSGKTNEYGTTVLAYIGDAAYELWIRKMLVEKHRNPRANLLHRAATKYVSAAGQSKAAKELQKGFLREEEVALLKRARNHRISSHPRGANPLEYKNATGFEALVGSLYMDGSFERLDDIMVEAEL